MPYKDPAAQKAYDERRRAKKIADGHIPRSHKKKGEKEPYKPWPTLKPWERLGIK